MSRPVRDFFPLALMAVLSVGCGSAATTERYAVSGSVEFGGQPVKDGDIIFESTAATKWSDAGKIVDGKFQFDATTGQKIVRIRASRDKDGPAIKGAMGEELKPKEEYIPDQYNSNSALTAEVTSNTSKNRFEFKLEAAK